MGVLFLIPLTLVVLVLLAYPVFSSLFFGLTNRSTIRPTYRIIWFVNYKNVLTDPAFWNAFMNSIKWTASSVVSQVIVGMTAALLLNRIRRCKAFFRSVLLIPWAFSNVAIAFTWSWLFNDIFGLINVGLINLGIISEPILFLADPRLAMPSAVLVNTWFGFPFVMVSVLAALQTIPAEEYEAARVDGGSAFKTFLHITLQHIKLVLGLVVVLRTIWVFNNFDLMFLLTAGGPGNSTETLPIYAYRTGWVLNSLGKASSIATILLVFLLGISVVYFKIMDRMDKGD
jgi:multiple sugar transport system permease protein